MRCRWLGWAGVEIEHDGETILIDSVADPAATYAALGEAAANVAFPEVVPGRAGAGAALLTHLHRDHADAAALADALTVGAPVLYPAEPEGSGRGGPGVAQARSELSESGLRLEPIDPWGEHCIGPFTVTALPAADGLGDAQVSWAVQAGGHRILHCGDTMFHGWWWRLAQVAGPFDVAFLPINGAVIDFPWRQPASPLAAMLTPEQAVVAARALGAARVVPIHFGAFAIAPHYRPVVDAPAMFAGLATSAGVAVSLLEVGDWIEV
jgi:L-ascorbate metabolism protein UlaG (beta-lactamase superfamily)